MMVSCIIYWQHVSNISNLLLSDLPINKPQVKGNGVFGESICYTPWVAFKFVFISAVVLAILLQVFLSKGGSTKLVVEFEFLNI
jgi:hypothetical protein